MTSASVQLVLLQHAEEAAFQWLLRDAACTAPNYDARDLAKLDNVVEAHLDGLRIAGEAGWEACREQVEQFSEPGEVFAAAVLAFGGSDRSRIDYVLSIIREQPGLLHAVEAAVEWLPFEQIADTLESASAADDPILRRLGLSGRVAHRQCPTEFLLHALRDQEPLVRARAFRAAGELGAVRSAQLLEQALQTEDDSDCASFAAWSAARLGERTPSVLGRLTDVALTLGPHHREAMDMALRCMDAAEAMAWFRRLRERPDQGDLAARAAGIIGDPCLLGDLLELMSEPRIARQAGESFSLITGADIEYEDLDADIPEGFEAGPTDEPDDPNVDMDPDENLPWPDPGLIAEWLEVNRSRFVDGNRYLLGREISEPSLHEAIRLGTQRQRIAASIELGVREPGQPLVRVRAPSYPRVC